MKHFISSNKLFVRLTFSLAVTLVFSGAVFSQIKYGKTDVAVWRETDGVFYILKSTDGILAVNQFGFTSDIPIAAYDTH